MSSEQEGNALCTGRSRNALIIRQARRIEEEGLAQMANAGITGVTIEDGFIRVIFIILS